MSRTSGPWLSESARRQLQSLHVTQKEQSLRLSQHFKPNLLTAREKPRRLSPLKSEK